MRQLGRGVRRPRHRRGAAIVGALQEKGRGAPKVSYKLRDYRAPAVLGRADPVVFPVAVEAGGDPRRRRAHDRPTRRSVPEELPVVLPPLEDFEPGDDPQGCLARCLDWLLPEGRPVVGARDEHDAAVGGRAGTLRFADPANTAEGWSAQAERDWRRPHVGAEHAVLHLLYALLAQGAHDISVVTSAEPFQKLVHQGMILGEDGEKMSKSRGNVINPDEIIEQHGADAMRVEMPGSLEAVGWQTEQISGVVRLLHEPARRARRRAGGRGHDAAAPPIKKVTNDEALGFNTAISR